MKTRFIFILALIIGSFSYAQTTDELFSKANDFYKNGQYSKAIQSYLKIEKQGFESDDLFFNLGNCYYKLNKVAPSIYYYEKALKLNPIHEDASNNLAFAKRMTIDIVEDLPKSFLQRFSSAVVQKLTYYTFMFFVMVIMVVFAFSNYDITQKSRSAIVFSLKSDIKNSPSIDGEEVFELHEGTKVYILDELSNWKKIKLADGKIGWINAADIKEI